MSDYLMWVPGSYSMASFIEEASRCGAALRVSQFPTVVELGKTRVFLAHDVGPWRRRGERVVSKGANKGRVVQLWDKPRLSPPVVFAYFVVARKEIVLAEGMSLSSPEGYGNRPPVAHFITCVAGATVMTDDSVRSEQRIVRRTAGLYLVSSRSDSIRILGSPRPLEWGRFLGFKIVAGDRILESKPWSEWGLTDEECSHRKLVVKETDKGRQSQLFPVEMQCRKLT